MFMDVPLFTNKILHITHYIHTIPVTCWQISLHGGAFCTCSKLLTFPMQLMRPGIGWNILLFIYKCSTINSQPNSSYTTCKFQLTCYVIWGSPHTRLEETASQEHCLFFTILPYYYIIYRHILFLLEGNVSRLFNSHTIV